MNNNLEAIGVASLPRNSLNFIDERALYNLLGKCNLPYDCLYDIFPYELIFYAEGRLESDREYHELNGYNLFSSIRQALGSQREFNNPFKKEEQKSVPSKREEQATIESLNDIFNLDIEE